MAGKTLKTTVEIAGSIDESFEKSIENAGKSIEDFGKNGSLKLGKLGDSAKKSGDSALEAGDGFTVFKGVLAGLATSGAEMALETLAEGVGAVKDNMFDLSGASAQLAASTGLSEEAAERYRDVMKEIKADNFSESYQDVASVMEETIQIMGELNDADMKDTVESAITLRDTFDMDVNETLRATDVMVKTMGADAEEAFDLIAKGAQNGLNRSDELTDNLTEYGSLWGQAGFSAQESFAIMENGLDAGAYNLDKVNDFVKEFGISLSDGRIEDNIESFSERTQELFEEWEDGEASTKDVFYSVIDDLENMANKQEALTLASTVWSAVGEDNAMQVLTALNDVNTGYDNVQGAMDRLQETKFSDLESATGQLKSALQENIITPLSEAAIPVITSLFEKATGVLDGIGEALTPQKTLMDKFIEDIQTANDETATLLENSSETMQGAEVDTAELEYYKDVLLDLNSETAKTEWQKYQMKDAVTQLSQSIPDLASAWDEETSSLKLTNEEITTLIDNQKDLVMQQALLAASEDAYAAKANAALAKSMADSAVEQQKKDLEELIKLNQESLASDPMAGWGYGDYYSEIIDLQSGIKDAEKEQKEANKTYEEASEKAEEMDGALKNAQETLGITAETTEDVADGANAAADGLDGMANASGALSQEAQEAAEEAQQAYEDMYESIRSSVEGSITAFSEFSGGTEVSASEVLENLQSQSEGISNWTENMRTLAAAAGQGMTQELYDYLAGLGTEGANLTQTLVDSLSADPEQFAQIAQTYTDNLKLTDEAALLANWTSVGAGISDATVSGMNIESTQATVGAQASASADTIVTAFSDAMNETYANVSAGLSNLKFLFSSTRFAFNQHIALPHFSMSGSFNAESRAVPSVSVSWYKEGGILTEPTIFGAMGGSFLGGGEAGKEAVLPLDVLWDNMGQMFDAAFAEQDSATATAGRLLSLEDFSLSDMAANNQSITYDFSGTTYSPVINVSGNADTDDIMAQLKKNESDFFDWLESWVAQKEAALYA